MRVELTKEIAAWVVLVIGSLAGVAGVLLPVVPGPVLIVGAAIVHKLLVPGYLGWWMIVALGFLAVLERLADFAGTVLGARWMGATRWGLLGAAIGGLVGIFFGLVGIFVGPIVGAFAAEWVVARRRADDSLKAGFGAGVGIGVSTIARLAIAMFMVALIVFDLLFLDSVGVAVE
ncbi:hypothetical protein ASA1KI_25080 [Opitutales bacterium ASA1]|nr:hypothetical protein ASA1KI_25080 [Opitutales bacterium ASA1]